MKIEVGLVQMIFTPETEMDMYYIGVISTENKARNDWEDGKVVSMTMTKEDVIIGLACKRD